MTTDGCTYCDCNAVGSTQSGCDSNGNCLCLEGTVGDKCDVCAEGREVMESAFERKINLSLSLCHYHMMCRGGVDKSTGLMLWCF